jgi:hypothetical protein
MNFYGMESSNLAQEVNSIRWKGIGLKGLAVVDVLLIIKPLATIMSKVSVQNYIFNHYIQIARTIVQFWLWVIWTAVFRN